MWVNPQETADLVTFAEEICYIKFSFCAVIHTNVSAMEHGVGRLSYLDQTNINKLKKKNGWKITVNYGYKEKGGYKYWPAEEKEGKKYWSVKNVGNEMMQLKK